ncbi:hypothetical protein ADIARSV_3792 [Arcticibacter svalbardensis MN12-7]|uniref:Outer membrane protein beta-barrel domain-containing protein n=1 Tax=Arcticibacter svalbardensis MN12-7 TaxID=1150600 RepID=R9GMU9_9SPHI|nr:hypothetical protein [Arcticibacter svalbardensis]EOR93036.1 hypothetical protein ADIARSV_3792 [Arcticibacter svalbardensis MN12-7]
MKNIFLAALLCTGVTAFSQQPNVINSVKTLSGVQQPFLFSVSTLTEPGWNINYSGSYGKNTTNPFGFNGVDQQFAVSGYLGSRFTLYAKAGIGFNESGGIRSLQQVEVIRDLIGGGGKAQGFRFGTGLGVRREWTNENVVFSRLTAALGNKLWNLAGNLLIEKAFDKDRDEVDLITAVGFHHKLGKQFFAGFEAAGEDLEGFWDKDEAEGGAKLFIGPSVNMTTKDSHFLFSLSGGPIIYATSSTRNIDSAPRDLNLSNNGYTVRFRVGFK